MANNNAPLTKAEKYQDRIADALEALLAVLKEIEESVAKIAENTTPEEAE